MDEENPEKAKVERVNDFEFLARNTRKSQNIEHRAVERRTSPGEKECAPTEDGAIRARRNDIPRQGPNEIPKTGWATRKTSRSRGVQQSRM